jgi:GNAT superfamily N-acetyltransferase
MELITADYRHIPLIQKIADQTWPVTYGPILSSAQIDYMIGLFYSSEALERQMYTGHRFLLTMEGDMACGFAGYEFDFPVTGTAKLHKLYVLPDWQGQGVGRILLDYVIQEALAAGNESLILNVNRHNPAKAFYERAGFKIMSSEDIDIGGDYFMNDYVMGKNL